MANQEHFDLLTQGVEAWNQWKGDTQGISPSPVRNRGYDADLTDADLSGAELSGAKLGNVDLANANFTGAYLVGTCLAGAELAEANFTQACLSGADLRRANVCAADFTNADLRDADLSGADLSEACFQGANLSRANLSRTDLSKACLQGANLSGANFSGVYSSSYLLEPYFHRAEIRSAKEAGALMRPARTKYQGTEGRTRFSSKRKGQSHDIVLYTRANSRLLRLTGIALLFVIAGVLMLHHPENVIQAFTGMVAVLFFWSGCSNLSSPIPAPTV